MKPRLLHLSSSYFPRIGGVPAFIRDVAHHTSDSFEHHLVCRDLVRAGPDPVRYESGTDASDPHITIHRFWSDGSYLTNEMQAFICEFNYDVLIVHTGNPALLKAIRLVGERQAILAAQCKTEWDISDLAPHVGHVLAMTPSDEQHYIHDHGIDSDKVSLLPRLVDMEQFTPGVKGRHRLLYVGRIAPEKRVWLLAGVLAELRKHDPEYTLRIVGDYDHPHRDRPPLRDALGTYKLGGDAVTFGEAQTVDELVAEYRQGDILVSASQGETFCQVFLEALASGLAVVSTAGGECREWATPYVAFTTTPQDVGEMVQLVKEAPYPMLAGWGLEPPSDVLRYAQLKQNYSWQARKDEFVGIVKGVL